MSGPKGHGYTVVSQEELDRREADALRVRIRTRLKEAGSLAPAGVPIAAPATTHLDRLALVELRAVDARTDRYVEAVHEAVASARVAESVQRVTGRLKSLVGGIDFSVAAAPTAAAPAAEGVGATSSDPRADLARRTARAGAAAAAACLRAETIDALLDLIPRHLESGDLAQVGLLVTQLEAEVTAGVRHARAQAALDRARAAALAATSDLAEEQDATVQVLRARLRAADDLATIEECSASLVAERERLRRDEDRRFVLEAARAELTALGYHVEVEDLTDQDATRMSVSRQDWPRHRLDLVFPESAATFLSVPVAVAATDTRDDAGFETATCRDLALVQANLGERGVDVTRTFERPPGETPIRRATGPDQSRKARASTPRALTTDPKGGT